jgi:hypothetical protein
LDEFVRDGLTTVEHWGSRISITKIQNFHCKTVGTGIRLQNDLSDPTTNYSDFNSLSAGGGSGVFFTGTQINYGHLKADTICVHVGGGVSTVKITNQYHDINGVGVKLDYGARKVSLDNYTLDNGGQYAEPWEPSTTYTIGDKIRRGELEYTCSSDGTSAANLDHNGVTNSEFVGVDEQWKGQPVASAGNPDSLLTQGKPHGIDMSGSVQCFIEGVEVIDGQRWLNMASYLPVATGGTENLNIWLGDLGLAQGLPAVKPNELFTSFQFQHRDPKITIQPSVTGRIRGATVSGGYTEQSTGIAIDELAGFSLGEVVTFTDTFTLDHDLTARAAPFLLISYSSAQFGYFPFRISVPQINAGSSLGSYVRTYGKRRSSWSDGPQGTGTGITDGTAEWDSSGDPICAIIAPRQAWEASGANQFSDIQIGSNLTPTQTWPSTAPLPHYFVVTPNPANSNSHPTTISD